MKVVASTSLLKKMAETYREFGDRRGVEGDDTAAAAGHEAANALEDVADLRAALAVALNNWELLSAVVGGEAAKRDEVKIAELRKLVKP